MNDLEGYPKICIRCKQSYDHIELFHYYRRYGGTSYGSASYDTKFPVCALCKMKFMSYFKAKKIAKKIKYPFMILLLITFAPILFYSYTGLLELSSTRILLIGVSFFVLIFVIAILPKIIVMMHPGNLSKHIKIKRNGDVVIKDPYFKNEMAKLYVEQVAEEVRDERYGVEDEDRIVCPKCGKEHREGIDFCNICGKDLRVIII